DVEVRPSPGLSLRSFARTGSALSALPRRDFRREDFWDSESLPFADWGSLHDFHHGSEEQLPPRLSTRDKSIMTSGKSPVLSVRLSLLDMTNLGQKLSIRSEEKLSDWGDRGHYSRLASLSMFDSMFMGSSLSLGRVRKPALSTREKSFQADNGKFWEQLALQDVNSLTSRMSLRPKQKTPAAVPLERLPNRFPEAHERKEPEELPGLRVWVGIQLGDLVAGVCLVRFHQERCVSMPETVRLWGNGSVPLRLAGASLALAETTQPLNQQLSASFGVVTLQ
ncbi:unnamed protein product, partial [Effrenium voratum]